MNILVTGANGQLGQCLRDIVEENQNSENTWFWTDVADIEGRDVRHLDITDEKAIECFFKDNSINVCVNCAAYTNVDKAEDDQELARKLNADAPGLLAKACKAHDAKLIHISTDYVFNGTSFMPLTEERMTLPTSVYGKTKLEGEENIVKSGCDYLIFRTAWLYSEYGNNFVKTMLRLVENNEEVKVVNDQIGTPTYAGNLAMLIYYIIAEVKPLEKTGIYHYTDEGACSWYDFAQGIACERGLYEIPEDKGLAAIIPVSTKEFYGDKKHASRPFYSVLNKGKVKRDFISQFETITTDIPHWMVPLNMCVRKIMEKREKNG